MQTLCIRDALSLYKTLKPHVPAVSDKDDAGSAFVKRIVDSMADTDPDAYLQSVLLMSGETKESLQEKYDGHQILGLFIDGLIANRVILLADFGKQVGL